MTQPAARRVSSHATTARKVSTTPTRISKTTKAIKAARPAVKPVARVDGADEINDASLNPTSRRPSGNAVARDQPLKKDIHFLGRLLDGVLRE